MIKALFKVIINLMATLIQIVCLPINAIISAALPDLSTKITQITSIITGVFDNISWALGLIPGILSETLLFIILIEIAKHTIFVSTHALIKIWNIFQKIKFW